MKRIFNRVKTGIIQNPRNLDDKVLFGDCQLDIVILTWKILRKKMVKITRKI